MQGGRAREMGRARERERERESESESESEGESERERERESARGGNQIPKTRMHERFVVGEGLYESSRAVNMVDGLPRAPSTVRPLRR